MIYLNIKSISSINTTAREFIALIKSNKVFLINGKMGAGKTTFIKAICEELGVTDNVNSPTFSIINEYKTRNGNTIYHFDCYRIKSLDEAKDIGIEDFLYSGNICFIEWSVNITPLLPLNATTVNIKELADGTRFVEFHE